MNTPSNSMNTSSTTKTVTRYAATPLNPSVTLNAEQRLYVIETGGGYSCLGFDICRARAERLALSLRLPSPANAPGTLELYAEYEDLSNRARIRFEVTGEKALCELSPQLSHLKGKRVEVVSMFGETRRFIVGQSGGFIPINLEIKRRDSTGGSAADRNYQSVRVIS